MSGSKKSKLACSVCDTTRTMNIIEEYQEIECHGPLVSKEFKKGLDIGKLPNNDRSVTHEVETDLYWSLSVLWATLNLFGPKLVIQASLEDNSYLEFQEFNSEEGTRFQFDVHGLKEDAWMSVKVGDGPEITRGSDLQSFWSHVFVLRKMQNVMTVDQEASLFSPTPDLPGFLHPKLNLELARSLIVFVEQYSGAIAMPERLWDVMMERWREYEVETKLGLTDWFMVEYEISCEFKDCDEYSLEAIEHEQYLREEGEYFSYRLLDNPSYLGPMPFISMGSDSSLISYKMEWDEDAYESLRDDEDEFIEVNVVEDILIMGHLAVRAETESAAIDLAKHKLLEAFDIVQLDPLIDDPSSLVDNLVNGVTVNKVNVKSFRAQP